MNVKNIFVTDGTRITSKQNPFFDLYGHDGTSRQLCCRPDETRTALKEEPKNFFVFIKNTIYNKIMYHTHE